MLCLATILGVASGSHFRYGTINWRAVTNPGECVGDACVACPEDMSNEDCKANLASYPNAMKTVDININLGYRRTYGWGTFTKESWQQLSGNESWNDTMKTSGPWRSRDDTEAAGNDSCEAPFANCINKIARASCRERV